MKSVPFVLLVVICASTVVLAQTNPVPFIDQPLVPMTAAPGGSGFALTVNGTGFVSSSSVNWNGSTLATTFVSNSQLTAAVPASDIANPGTPAKTFCVTKLRELVMIVSTRAPSRRGPDPSS